MQTLIRDLLKVKGQEIWSVAPDATMLEALHLLAEKDIGALLVMENGELVGIVSERDFARAIARNGKCLVHSDVKQYMTGDVITVTPDHTVQECMKLMTQDRIRHLPVIEHGQVIAVISIGDIVKTLLAEAESTIHHLEDFIEGRYGR